MTGRKAANLGGWAPPTTSPSLHFCARGHKLPRRLWRALSLQDLHLSQIGPRAPSNPFQLRWKVQIGMGSKSFRQQGRTGELTFSPRNDGLKCLWRSLSRLHLSSALPVMDANMNGFATSCRSQQLEFFCVIETHSQHFFRAPTGAWRAARRCSAKAFRENSSIQLQWRLWFVIDHFLVELGSAELEAASLAAQLESRRSSVPEKLALDAWPRFTRLMATAPHRSCSFLGSRGCTECGCCACNATISKLIHSPLLTSSARLASSSRPILPLCLVRWKSKRRTRPNNFHARISASRSPALLARCLSRRATPKQNLNLPRRNPGQDFIIGTLWRNTSSRFTWSNCSQLALGMVHRPDVCHPPDRAAG